MSPANRVTRREFVRDSAAVAAGAAMGLMATYHVRAGNPDKARHEQDPQLQPPHGIPPLRQDQLDDLGRLPGRALEADRQGRWRMEQAERAGSAPIWATRSSSRTATTSSAAASIAASTTSTPASAAR